MEHSLGLTRNPSPLPGLSATAIAAGFEHTCALWSDSSVACWGANDYGQLGIGSTMSVGDLPGYILTAVKLGSGAWDDLWGASEAVR